jgi:flagellar protein FliS
VPARNPASAYQAQAVTTANGPHLLIMLFDRLAVDIARGEAAIEAKDFQGANEHLQHAQKIIRLLRNTLDPDGFKGGQELLSVYVFVENHLIKANLEKNVDIVRECAKLIAPIHEAWRKAVNADDHNVVFSDLG